MKEKNKIGIFPGSFDPFHIGHLAVATAAYNNGLDEIIVLPAWQNPWKKKSTDYWARLMMCELMTEGYDFIEVSNLEGLMRNEFTYQALQRIKETRSLDGDLSIIGGTDAAETVSKWREGDWILQNFSLINIYRPGYYPYENSDEPGIDISSTKIRQMIKDGKAPFPYINHLTYEFIKNNKLYTENYD